jgi:hypothetical protein
LGDKPVTVRSFQASSINLRKLASAFCAGSVATTLRPARDTWQPSSRQ